MSTPENTKSIKAVDGVSPTTKPDDGGTATPIPPTNTGSPSAAPKLAADGKNATNVPDGTISQLTEAEKDQNAVLQDAAFEKALAEKDSALSAAEQKALDTHLGDEPEFTSEPEYERLRDMKSQMIAEDNSLTGRLKAFVEAEQTALAVITGIVSAIPSDTPDDYVLGGVATHRLKLGHLRALVMGIHK